MKDQIHALLRRHHGKIREEVDAICRQVATLPELDGTGTETFIRQVHTLKGSCGSMGFTQVFEACRDLEAELRAADRAPLPENLPGIARLAAHLHATAARTEITDSTLYAKFG